jgi:hypothetical protein
MCHPKRSTLSEVPGDDNRIKSISSSKIGLVIDLIPAENAIFVYAAQFAWLEAATQALACNI